MTIHHMNSKQYGDFKAERKGVEVKEASFAPSGVEVLHMKGDYPGVVVAFDDGKGGAFVVGDTIDVYAGDEPPSYFA
nr:hypothetical protein [uncultured Cohaesibacter sp.]